MTRKPLLLLVITFLCLLPVTTNAFAKGGLFGAGARFAWQNFKKPILVHESQAAADIGTLDANDFGGPNFGGEFQLRPIDRLSIGLSIDMGLTTHTVFPYTGGDNDIESKATCFSFGVLLGGKFYIMEPEAEKASLYLHVAVGKYFSKVSNSAVDVIENPQAKDSLEKQTEVIGDLSSPIVVQLAVGAEYFLSESFSLGADLLGFRMGFAKASVGQNAQGFSGEHKLFTFSIYSAVTMNFGFGGGKSKTKENDDAWGASGGAAAGGGATAGGASDGGEGDGWGASGDSGAAPANDGWGEAPADNGGGDAGWGAAPADNAAPPADNGGWEAQPAAPAPAPAPSGGGGASKPRPKKSKPAAPATPPPPPPGY